MGRLVGFSQTSVDSSAECAEAVGATMRSGWIVPLLCLVFALCLVSFSRPMSLAAEAQKAERSLFSQSASETSDRIGAQATVTGRLSRSRIFAQKFETPAVLAQTGPLQKGASYGLSAPVEMELAVSVGRAGLPARAPPINGIL